MVAIGEGRLMRALRARVETLWARAEPGLDCIVALHDVAPGDEGVLFEIHRAVFRAHIERIWGWDEKWQRRDFRRSLESAATHVVRAGGRTAGFLQIDESPEYVYLRNLAVLPAAQGRGIGSCLVESLQEEAASRGVPIRLVVFRTNPRAVRFYERFGFRTTGETDAHVEMSWSPGAE